MAFKVLVWHSSPTFTASADRIFWRFAQAFGANDVLLTNKVPAFPDTLAYKCFLLLLPAPPAGMPAEWRETVAATDTFLTQLREIPPRGIRVIPVVSKVSEVSHISSWYPAFAGLASRQAAALDEQDFERQLHRLVEEVQSFRRATPLRRAAAYTSVLLAFGVLAAGLLGQFEDYFATWDAASVVVEVIDKDSIRLRGSTFPRADLAKEVGRQTYRRRNDPQIVLKFSDALDYGDLVQVATELNKAGHKRIALDVGSYEPVELRFNSEGPSQRTR